VIRNDERGTMSDEEKPSHIVPRSPFIVYIEPDAEEEAE
jgi:hypothetical protein